MGHSDKINFTIDSRETVEMLVSILVEIKADLGFITIQLIEMRVKQGEDPEKELEKLLKKYNEYTTEKRLRVIEDIIINFFPKDPVKKQNSKSDSS